MCDCLAEGMLPWCDDKVTKGGRRGEATCLLSFMVCSWGKVDLDVDIGAGSGDPVSTRGGG